MIKKLFMFGLTVLFVPTFSMETSGRYKSIQNLLIAYKKKNSAQIEPNKKERTNLDPFLETADFVNLNFNSQTDGINTDQINNNIITTQIDQNVLVDLNELPEVEPEIDIEKAPDLTNVSQLMEMDWNTEVELEKLKVAAVFDHICLNDLDDLDEKSIIAAPTIFSSNIREPVKKTLQCKFCDNKLSTWNLWKQHMENDHPTQKPYECRFCSLGTNKLKDLADHLKDIHGLRQYPCPFCIQIPSSISDFEKHVLRHTEERPFKCRVKNCVYAGKTESNLAEHVKRGSHRLTSERKFKCPVKDCIYLGKTKIALKAHVERGKHKLIYTSENETAEDLVSTIVVLESKSNKRLASEITSARPRKKIRKKSTDKKYKCIYEGCDKAYSAPSNLRRHTRGVHENGWKCNFCAADFSNPDSLRKHVRNLHKKD